MHGILLWLTLAGAGAAAVAGACAEVATYRKARCRPLRALPHFEVTQSYLHPDTTARYVRLDLINRAEVGVVVTSIMAVHPVGAKLHRSESLPDPKSELPFGNDVPAATQGVWHGLPRHTFSFWLRDGGMTPRLKIAYRWHDSIGRKEEMELDARSDADRRAAS